MGSAIAAGEFYSRHSGPVLDYRWKREQMPLHQPASMALEPRGAGYTQMVPRPGGVGFTPPTRGSRQIEPDSTNSKGFPCKKCGKVYSSHSGLHVHMQFHSGRFSYWCESCQKGFTCKGNYDYHMAKHSGIDFPCNRCTKRFQSQKGLRSHMIKEHN